MRYRGLVHSSDLCSFICSYLPTKVNVQRWKLQRRMRNKLLDIIKSRLNSKEPGYGSDLLGLMMESTGKQDGVGLNTNEIIDECKTFFFAGHETTSHLLTWTMFLLSTNLEWQEKLRDEVVGECGMEIPNADSLNKLKLVTLVGTLKFPRGFCSSYLTIPICR